VRYGAECAPTHCHDGSVRHKKAKKLPGDATYSSVKKEMAKPRMSKSARIAERNLDSARVPEQPSATMPGAVDKIIPPLRNRPEKAQIAIDRADRGHRDLRIENSLTNENGDEVKLKKGAHVEVTFAAKNLSRHN